MSVKVMHENMGKDEAPREQAAGPLSVVIDGLKLGLYQGIQAAIHGTDAEP